nr:retrovirus-related Pol polyprotein from transposon TNT 1-94 [Tanacetum cinerariifolium]
MCWNCNQKGHFQNHCTKLVASKDKEDSSASFHATYCKEELEKFKLRSGKVRLADDKTLDIEGIGYVVVKNCFGTSWTLKDVRYTLSLKRRLISVGQLDEEGYHVGFGDQVAYSKGGMAREGYKSHTLEGYPKQRYHICGLDSSSLTKPVQKSQVVLVDILENLAENDRVVAEHGLSSEITQSPGGSSDMSEGSKNSGSFKDSGRSDEEYYKDGASSKEGSSETSQVQRSTKESRSPVRYSPSTNYLLLTENGEPKSYSKALSSKESVQWKKAIIEEMVSLEKKQT